MQDSQRTSSERDALFTVVTDPRRRRLIDILDSPDAGHRTTLYDLSGRLAAEEGSVGGEERHEAAIALHHVHLPRLDDAGLVAYDPETKTIEAVDLSSVRADAGREMPVTEE